MPRLPAIPASEEMDIDKDGNITGWSRGLNLVGLKPQKPLKKPAGFFEGLLRF